MWANWSSRCRQLHLSQVQTETLDLKGHNVCATVRPCGLKPLWSKQSTHIGHMRLIRNERMCLSQPWPVQKHHQAPKEMKQAAVEWKDHFNVFITNVLWHSNTQTAHHLKYVFSVSDLFTSIWVVWSCQCGWTYGRQACWNTLNSRREAKQTLHC